MKNKHFFLVKKFEVLEYTDTKILIRTPYREYEWEKNHRFKIKYLESNKIQLSIFKHSDAENVYRTIASYEGYEY